MKKIILSLIFIVLFCAFASAQNRIFSGYINRSDIYLTPLSNAYSGIEEYSQGNSNYSVNFFDNSNLIGSYRISENNLKINGQKTKFYFIADVPETTDKVCFNKQSEIKCFNLNEDIIINSFNVNCGQTLNFSWNVSANNNYFVSIYSKSDGEFTPLLYESEAVLLGNSLEISADYADSGIASFKLIASTVGSQDEKITDIVIPNKKPKVKILSPLNNSVFNNNSILVEASVEDINLAEIKWYLDNQPLSHHSNSFNLKNLGIGEHKLRITADDSLGLSSSKEITFYINPGAVPQIILNQNIQIYEVSRGLEFYYAKFKAFITLKDYLCDSEFSENGKIINQYSFYGTANSRGAVDFWFTTSMIKNHIGKMSISCYDIESNSFNLTKTINFSGEYSLVYNPADTNKDCIIDASDYLTVKMNYGRTGCNVSNKWCDGADMNNDTKVDWDDWQSLMSGFGESGCLAILPEIPAQLPEEETAENLIVQEAPVVPVGDSGSGSSAKEDITSSKTIESSKLSGETITSNVIKTENKEKDNEKTTKESKLSGFTKIIAKTIEIIKKAVISLFFHSKQQ